MTDLRFKEIEHKFVVDGGFDLVAFRGALAALAPLRHSTLRVRDRYFVTEAGRARGFVIRHRHDRELHELTVKTVAADDPVLTKGWYAPERQGTALWRWSNGDAVLPVSGRGNACILEVRIADSATYILRKEPAARIAA